MENSKTFFVIVTYNGSEYIGRCIQTVSKYFKTIVVDNNSSDNTLDLCRKYPISEYFTLDRNIGFGQANNLGIEKALSEGADYVFLLNQDAYLEQDCVEKLIEVHQSNPEYGILSPIHLNGEGTNLDFNFNEYLKRINNDNLVFDLLKGRPKKVYSLPFVNAAGWLIPKSTIERVGLFDPMFFHYGEDENYCQRVRAHDLQVGVVPSANMRHDREGRVRPNISDKLNKDVLERKLKLYLGDINITPDFKVKKRVWRNEIFKSMFKFNFRTFQINLLKYRTLVSVIPEILESRERNRLNY